MLLFDTMIQSNEKSIENDTFSKKMIKYARNNSIFIHILPPAKELKKNFNSEVWFISNKNIVHQTVANHKIAVVGNERFSMYRTFICVLLLKYSTYSKILVEVVVIFCVQWYNQCYKCFEHNQNGQVSCEIFEFMKKIKLK